MSSKSRRRHARPSLPDVQAQALRVGGDDVDCYVPDYGRRCDICEQSPTVTGLCGGRVVVNTGLCGQCCFGNVAALDPDTWNR